MVSTLEELLALAPTVVLECAGHAALRKYGVDVLRSGTDLLTLSVGALVDPLLLMDLETAAHESRAHLRVPSGAIAGLDGISAAALGGLDRVVHTVRKPARTLLGSEAEGLREPRELYRGPARAGVALFPQSVNVVAAVSLAGIGFDATEMRVIADPSATVNEHVIEASGAFGSLRIQIQNVPSTENPRTGKLTAMSAFKALQDYCASVTIG